MAKSIEVVYTHEDGSTTHATFAPDVGWQQWGNTPDKLSDTVELTEAIAEAIYEWRGFDTEEDEDE